MKNGDILLSFSSSPADNWFYQTLCRSSFESLLFLYHFSLHLFLFLSQIFTREWPEDLSLKTDKKSDLLSLHAHNIYCPLISRSDLEPTCKQCSAGRAKTFLQYLCGCFERNEGSRVKQTKHSPSFFFLFTNSIQALFTPAVVCLIGILLSTSRCEQRKMTPGRIYLLVQFKQTTEKVHYNHLFLCQTHRSGVEV